ncbi:Predicted dehydrogenase [Nonomuraea solani]|uniref:Predicted dehydrogenase n=1 Tax=Nonomuraea solani TaxID=1144553 RepID=A0A1H6EW70_9ACTN|nr:Gfo/Idh/MocA family oxidoreductase [Nonomuraea solani]SEH01341.1 Predicted dehydrogenase [Nonomuraea solani]
MATPTRWGILATGGIAAAFVSDLALLPDAEVVAVGSRRLDTAQAFAAERGIPRAYGSWAELAAAPDVDVVYVATPHAAHHAAAHLCLSAGKPVLVEKPITLDRASAADLVATARERGVFLMEAMWTRALPAIRRMRELVADGAIGEVTAVYADFAISGPFAPTHRLRAPELGGGALLDLGVYPVTFTHLFLGVPSRISAMATLTPEGVDENTAMTFGYDSGALAVLHCGIVGGSPVSATVLGTRGRIVIPKRFFGTTGFTLVRGGESEEMTFPRSGNGLAFEAEEVMACLAAGRTESDLVPHAATLDVMGILDEVRKQIGVSYA